MQGPSGDLAWTHHLDDEVRAAGVAMGVLWVLLPMVVFGVLGALLLPEDPPARAVRSAARRLVRAVGRPFVRAWRRLRPPPPPPPPDPFEVLSLQLRLGLLADQLRVLENDPQIFARARRHMAVRAAYDALLIEACRLAGVELEENGAAAEADGPLAGWDAENGSFGLAVVSDRERFREEMELASRGWSW